MGRAVAAGILAGALAVTVAGCGDSSSPASAPGADPALEAPINLANCTDWNEGSLEQRFGTIRKLRDFVGRPVTGTGGRGAILDDEKAYDLFENYCENEFARGFRLYKLYSRAAAFEGQ